MSEPANPVSRPDLDAIEATWLEPDQRRPEFYQQSEHHEDFPHYFAIAQLLAHARDLERQLASERTARGQAEAGAAAMRAGLEDLTRIGSDAWRRLENVVPNGLDDLSDVLILSLNLLGASDAGRAMLERVRGLEAQLGELERGERVSVAFLSQLERPRTLEPPLPEPLKEGES